MLFTGGLGQSSGQRRPRRECLQPPLAPPPGLAYAESVGRGTAALPRLPGITRARPCSGLSPAVTTLSTKVPPHQLSVPRERPSTQYQPQRLSRSDTAALEALKAADKPRRGMNRSSTTEESVSVHLQRQPAAAFAARPGDRESVANRGTLFRQPSALRRPPSSVVHRPPSAMRPRALPPLAATFEGEAPRERDGCDAEMEEEEEEESDDQSEPSLDESEAS